MKKKGFTLIELLAVIVIVGLISLITIPIVTNMIESSRKKAFKESVVVLAGQVERYMTKYDDYEKEDHDEITVDQMKKVAKHKFTDGKFVIYNNDKEVWYITDGRYCAKGKIKDLRISRDCYKLDDTEAEVDATKVHLISTSKTVRVTIDSDFAQDSESGIKKYILELYQGSNLIEKKEISSIETVVFDNLNHNTEYKVVVDVINRNDVGLETKVEKTITTTKIDPPTYSIDIEGWAQSKVVTINFNDSEGKYTHYYTKDNGDPVEVTENTVDVTFTANGSLIAEVTDGHNRVTGYEAGSSYDVTTIDTTPPSVSASIGTRTTNSVVVNATCSDESDITLIEYSSNNGSSYVSDSTNTSHTFTGLSQGTSYNFKVRCTNGAALRNESSTASATTKATAAFNGNGGSNGTSKTLDVGAQLGELPSSSRSYTITYNTNSQSATSSKSNETVSYTFNGWYTATSGGTKISTTTTMPSGGTTYYAQWTSKSTTLATITRTGYTCTWNTKSDGTGTSYASGKTGYTPSSTHTLYARCSINQYTATFNGNGGTNGTSITKNYGTALGTLPSSTRDNYVLAGWYTAASGGSQISSSTTMPAGGATYYAHWTAAKAYSSQTKAYYTTVQAAITATSSGTVKVLANSSENLTIASGKSITFNLNSKTVTGSVTNSGTVTMNGSGQITGYVTNNGTFTLTNGTIILSSSGYVFENKGTFTMNGGTINYNYSDHGVALYNNSGKTINVNGGTITSKGYAVVTHGGTTNIKNASVTGNGAAILNRNSGTTYLNPGTTLSATSYAIYHDTGTTIIVGASVSKGVIYGMVYSAGKVNSTTYRVAVYNKNATQCPTWTNNAGQDDLVWHAATYVTGNYTYSYCDFALSSHKNETGTYTTHFYDSSGGIGGFSWTPY